MKEFRAAWAAIIISAAVMYLFDNGTVTLAVLVAAVCLPLISLLSSYLQERYITVSLTESENADSGNLKISVINRSFLPAPHSYAVMEFRNIRTGVCRTVTVPIAVTPFCRKETAVSSEMSHYGRYQIRLKETVMSDALRLRQIRKSFSRTVYFTVRPGYFPVSLEISGSSAALPDSERYSDRRSGNDPGEVRAIHEYVPGDPVRNIHWKLSEKADKLLVKELGLPVTDRFMAVLDTSAGSRTDEEGMDAVAAVYAGLLEALRREGLEFSACWTEPENNYLSVTKINDDEDLQHVKDRCLAVPRTDGDLCGQLLDWQSSHRSAHLIIVGTDKPSGIERLAGSCKVTLLLLEHSGSISIEDGLSVYGYGKRTYAGDLAHIEI